MLLHGGGHTTPSPLKVKASSRLGSLSSVQVQMLNTPVSWGCRRDTVGECHGSAVLGARHWLPFDFLFKDVQIDSRGMYELVLPEQRAGLPTVDCKRFGFPVLRVPFLWCSALHCECLPYLVRSGAGGERWCSVYLLLW